MAREYALEGLSGTGGPIPLGFPLHLKCCQCSYLGETGAWKLPWNHEASWEKASELEANANLATWSVSLTNASVSGCSIGALGECVSKWALGIPRHCAVLKCCQKSWQAQPCCLLGSSWTGRQMAEPLVWSGNGGAIWEKSGGHISGKSVP